MDRLNYHHLLYFWTVARLGGLGPAADELLLSRSTLSAQIHQLEETLGHKLLRRSNRRLQLTDTGASVFEYCNRMFLIGRQLGESLANGGMNLPVSLRVGVSEVIPRLVVGKLLGTVVSTPQKFRLVCREANSKQLLAELAMQNLDIVIDDGPVSHLARIKGHSRLLAGSDVFLFGSRTLVARYKAKFPQSLDGAPLLLPSEGSALRHELDRWFDRIGIRPRVVGEFEDRDLLEVFGQLGAGIFPAPALIRQELKREYSVGTVGRAKGLREEYYAISIHRQVRHGGVAAIINVAPGGDFS